MPAPRLNTAVSSLSGTPLFQLVAVVKKPLELVFQPVVTACAEEMGQAQSAAIAIFERRKSLVFLVN